MKLKCLFEGFNTILIVTMRCYITVFYFQCVCSISLFCFISMFPLISLTQWTIVNRRDILQLLFWSNVTFLCNIQLHAYSTKVNHLFLCYVGVTSPRSKMFLSIKVTIFFNRVQREKKNRNVIRALSIISKHRLFKSLTQVVRLISTSSPYPHPLLGFPRKFGQTTRDYIVRKNI